MIPLNRKEIRKRSLHFWLLFVCLAAFTLVPATAFTWAMREQTKAFTARVWSYRQMENKQLQLHQKIDSLYTQVTYVNTAKVGNYLYLEKDISDNKSYIAQSIGADSEGRFRMYAHLVNNLNSHLLLRDTIVKVEGRETMIKSDLVSCMSRNKEIRKSIFSQTQLAAQ